MIRITLDEDLPCEMLTALYEAGHDVRTVHDQRFTGWTDEQLLAETRAEGEERWLFTADEGFVAAKVGEYEGIVVFRPERASRRGFLGLVGVLLGAVDWERCGGRVMVVTAEGVEVVSGAAGV